MKKYLFKGSTCHVKQQPKGDLDCKWFSFKDGDAVPEELVDLVKLHGGKIVCEEEKKVELKKKKTTTKKVSKKK